MKAIKVKVVAIFSLPLLFALFALPVVAEEVTFSTTGEFCAGSGPCTASPTSVIIGSGNEETYLAANPTSTSVAANTLGVPLIDITVADIGAAARAGFGSFTIAITQTAPTVGAASLTGSLSGNFAVGSNSASIDFTQDSVSIGDVSYILNSQTYTFPVIEPPSKVVTILADVTVAPEPDFLAFTGVGFACLWFAAHRRRVRRQRTVQAHT